MKIKKIRLYNKKLKNNKIKYWIKKNIKINIIYIKLKFYNYANINSSFKNK